MCDIFENRDLRSQTNFMRARVNISNFGRNSLKYLVTKVWDIVPYDIKLTENLELFKRKIRKWEHNGCHCKIHKEYVYSIGYVDTF